MSRASSLSSEFGHTEVSSRIFIIENRNMDISGSHCYSIRPNSGQFKDSQVQLCPPDQSSNKVRK